MNTEWKLEEHECRGEQLKKAVEWLKKNEERQQQREQLTRTGPMSPSAKRKPRKKPQG